MSKNDRKWYTVLLYIVSRARYTNFPSHLTIELVSSFLYLTCKKYNTTYSHNIRYQILQKDLRLNIFKPKILLGLKTQIFPIKSTRCVVLISILSYFEFMTQLMLEIIAHRKFNWRRQ